MGRDFIAIVTIVLEWLCEMGAICPGLNVLRCFMSERSDAT